MHLAHDFGTGSRFESFGQVLRNSLLKPGTPPCRRVAVCARMLGCEDDVLIQMLRSLAIQC